MNANNFGSGDGFVPSDNKPLPEPTFSQIYVDIKPQCVKR